MNRSFDWYHNCFETSCGWSYKRKEDLQNLYPSSWLMILFRAHIENVDILVGMYSAYMGPYVWRVFRTIRTVRTVKSRQLATLELEVIIQIVLARERVAALVAGVIPVLLCSIRIVDTLIGMRVKSLHGDRSNLWEQKISKRNSGRKLKLKQSRGFPHRKKN